MLPLAVLYDGNDGQRFVNECPRVRGICALTPIAVVVVRHLGLPVIDAGERYRDCSHARTILRRERLRRAWRSIATSTGNPDQALWYVLDVAFVVLFHGYDRLRSVLGEQGPWLIPGAGRWTVYDRREDACLAVCHHILSRYRFFLGNDVCKPPPLAALYRTLRVALIFLGRGRRLAWVTTRSDHPLGLEKALVRASPRSRQWHFSIADGGLLEYVRLVRELWRILRGAHQIQLRAIPVVPRGSEQVAMRAIDAFPDPEIRTLLRAFSPAIMQLCGIAGGSYRDFTCILPRLRPNFMLASEITDGITAALFAACSDRGIDRRICSHNSFAPVSGFFNLTALRDQIAHQYSDGAAEQMLFWTPSALTAAKQAFPQKTYRFVGLATVAIKQVTVMPADRPFQILHASNCMRYFSRAGWLYENVNEFVSAAVALAQFGLQVENTTYMIRTKVRRFEMDEATLRALLPVSDRIAIAFRHTRPFKEDLARADLLVAFRSTTIMQALYARKPVLLWGISPRYREFLARTTLPRRGDRAAVYTVYKADELPAMLAAIRDAHHGLPLTDAELAPYLWPPGTMTIETWARSCLTSPSA